MSLPPVVCLVYVYLCLFVYMVVFNTYIVFCFCFCFSSSCVANVASFSGLSFCDYAIGIL